MVKKRVEQIKQIRKTKLTTVSQALEVKSMATKLARWNSRSIFRNGAALTPIMWEGFDERSGPVMVGNRPEGLVFRLNFDVAQANTNYMVFVMVEDLNNGLMKPGQIVTRHTDYVDVSGGATNGTKRDLIINVYIQTGG